jgi:protein-tyrosine phosphatase
LKAVDEVFWVKGEPAASLAIVLRPRGGDWLKDELLRMRREGIQTLVSLLEPQEAAYLGLEDEGRIAEETGLHFLSHPIPDVHVPQNPSSFREFVSDLARRLKDGEKIGVHCRGSIGRATVTAACTLIHLGWSPKDALAAIGGA